MVQILNNDLMLAEQIVKLIFHKRRLLANDSEQENFQEEAFLHIQKVLNFVKNKQPIHMILPAFPAKSPNRKKL